VGVLEHSDALWRGDLRVEDHHPFQAGGGIEEVADGVAFLPGFANVTALRTDDGLVMVDTGSPFTAAHVHEQVRAWSSDPLRLAIFSHGHIDHVSGMGPFEEEARERGDAAPIVLAHEAMPARFDRYRLTAGWNGAINGRQFAGGAPIPWPTDYRYPDETYGDQRAVEMGGVGIQLHHARGETDDHTWTWIPERKVLCSGDLFIWASPNAGNPQKVQRYPSEWAAALRRMAGLGAELLLPGHGVPVAGADRVRQALSDTAALLESLVEQTLALMNTGADLDTVLHTVTPPADLMQRPYLRPVYDEPEFVVHTVWRQYGGWWNGDPSTLHPAPSARLATELADLSGGAERLAARAAELADSGELRIAGHLVELARRAAPDDDDVAAVAAAVNRRRADAATSTMAKGIYNWAAARDAPS
jgi:alkyl sulfatase BDS1-like metallo-beta-lactamase superfamily hydrolase